MSEQDSSTSDVKIDLSGQDRTDVKNVQLDMLNRDPNDINPHLKVRIFIESYYSLKCEWCGYPQVSYDEVIGEPEGAHSADCVWENSFKCFHIGRDCCYTVLTFVCAIPLAFCWGCT